ncbi:MAG: alpha/beta fold hydrolase [Actinomycetota bacterium]|nr:alpha/beta fold hydrolase [Actinomycetota bacterium]
MATSADVMGCLPRATLGGGLFRATYAAAVVLGRIYPRLARPALLKLWFTPWVHPSALAPITDVPTGVDSWSLPVDGATLRGYAGGAGRTVVLVHGWSGSAADWRHLAGDLIAAGWRVVVPDLPAHGMTAGRQTDLFVLGRALAAVLGRERPEGVVTHSMGFPATMLALEDGAPAPRQIVALAPGRKIVRAIDGFVQRASLAPRLVDELRRGIQRRYGDDVWDVLDVDRVVADLTPAGVVIHDADDDEVPLDDGRHIAATWPGARLIETSGFGHRRILRDGTVRRLVVEALDRETAVPRPIKHTQG